MKYIQKKRSLLEKSLQSCFLQTNLCFGDGIVHTQLSAHLMNGNNQHVCLSLYYLCSIWQQEYIMTHTSNNVQCYSTFFLSHSKWFWRAFSLLLLCCLPSFPSLLAQQRQSSKQCKPNDIMNGQHISNSCAQMRSNFEQNEQHCWGENCSHSPWNTIGKYRGTPGKSK